MFLMLAAGAALLLGSLLAYAVAMALILHVAAAVVRRGYRGQSFWRNVAVMMMVTLIMATAHLTQVALWALTLMLCGLVSDFERAFYCSAQNYTTLSYGDVLLPERWRLLGPLEAMNGLLFFGLSTAVLFAVLSRLMIDRVRAEVGHPGEAGSKGVGKPFSGNQSHAG
jgi:hypothetical protein